MAMATGTPPLISNKKIIFSMQALKGKALYQRSLMTDSGRSKTV